VKGWGLVIVGLGIAACGPAIEVPGETDDDSGSSTTGNSSAGVTSAMTSSSTSGTVTSGDVTGTVTSGTVSTTTDSGTTGIDMCPPRDFVQGAFWVMPENTPVAGNCLVIDYLGSEDASEYQLECETGPVTLTLTSNAGSSTALIINEEVELAYEIDPVFWINRWLSIRTTGGAPRTVVAAISGSVLDPPGTSVGAFFGDVDIAEVQSCEPIPDDCATTQRLGLGISAWGTEPQIVYDGSAAYSGGVPDEHFMMVETAVRYSEPFNCTDIPGAWYEVLIVRPTFG
jgi:hypothetical protein